MTPEQPETATITGVPGTYTQDDVGSIAWMHNGRAAKITAVSDDGSELTVIWHRRPPVSIEPSLCRIAVALLLCVLGGIVGWVSGSYFGQFGPQVGGVAVLIFTCAAVLATVHLQDIIHRRRS